MCDVQKQKRSEEGREKEEVTSARVFKDLGVGSERPEQLPLDREPDGIAWRVGIVSKCGQAVEMLH